jgi:hypothetical protein
MNSGKHQLQKFIYGGQDYYLILNKNDDDPGYTIYTFYVTKGSWQVSQPEIIAAAFINTADSSWQPDIDAWFQTQMDNLNQQLIEYFKPHPEPTPWATGAVDNCTSLVFITNKGLQVRKRNWGANETKNRWMASRTGYSGDFKDGLFAIWCPLNGWDIQALIAEYEASN